MLANSFVVIILLAGCYLTITQAYPALLPYIYNPSHASRLDKRSDAVFPQIEDDVSELDQLRLRQPDGSTVRTTTTTKKSDPLANAGAAAVPETMPDLEHQLEVATPFISMSTTTTTSTSATTTADFKDESERSQLEEPKAAGKPAPEPNAHAKNAQNLLRNPNGQYSSFDMAQYVYWTGDEAGVARAVEELINENVISRESALKFLRDIRRGIEYLQSSYANRIFPDELRSNHLKRSSPPSTTPATSSTSTTTTTTTTTTEKPLPAIHLERDAMSVGHNKALDSFSFWNKLKALDNEAPQDITEYDDTLGRAKIVEYLYNEYSLEEILYKLAKVMFAQSLSHGSDEAQQELQKLTEFLEREGNLGVIPADLQKKVLRVLLTALSDTLSEHPELLPAARVNLANPYFRLPLHVPSA
ncbi:uncharacterized protein LOC108603203 isoform X3 [Drosophila busckii]|uniref:uncharacterized protein LOC108603203 isoform X3 n=1 Tax=Drosophila busckii TaxID=30019 RepID=UPI00083F3E8D|nr:uncharacterized protein LOC108603203 isoform X3 [Drosophila busckii]